MHEPVARTSAPGCQKPPEIERQAARVVRLQPWSIEVVRERPDRPWDEAVGLYSKRKDAERAAQEISHGR